MKYTALEKKVLHMYMYMVTLQTFTMSSPISTSISLLARYSFQRPVSSSVSFWNNSRYSLEASPALPTWSKNVLNKSIICFCRISRSQSEYNILQAILRAAWLLGLNNIPLSQRDCFRMATASGEETIEWGNSGKVINQTVNSINNL